MIILNKGIFIYKIDCYFWLFCYLLVFLENKIYKRCLAFYHKAETYLDVYSVNKTKPKQIQDFHRRLSYTSLVLAHDVTMLMLSKKKQY